MSLKKLINGFASFHTRHFRDDPEPFASLVESGQRPKVALIACADSRVNPSVVLNADPGDLFVIRNVANRIPSPQYGADGTSVIAGLEYAIRALEVEHIVVMGHSHCGGIRALIDEVKGGRSDFPYVSRWMSSLAPICKSALDGVADGHGDPRLESRAVEQAGVRASLANLAAYPWVQERINQHRLQIHGWYFDMESGDLLAHNPRTNTYVPLVDAYPND